MDSLTKKRLNTLAGLVFFPVMGYLIYAVGGWFSLPF